MAKASFEVLYDRLAKAIVYAMVEFDLSRAEVLGVLTTLQFDTFTSSLPGDPEGDLEDAEEEDEEDE